MFMLQQLQVLFRRSYPLICLIYQSDEGMRLTNKLTAQPTKQTTEKSRDLGKRMIIQPGKKFPVFH
jgi:hypothetical protein